MKFEKERRLQKRHPYAKLACSMWSAHDVQVVNISLGGIQIRTNRRLTLDREYPFKLVYHQDSIPLSGIVKWCFLVGSTLSGPGEQTPVYSAGLRIQDRNAEKAYKTLGLSEEVCTVPPREQDRVQEAADGKSVFDKLPGEHTAWVQMPLSFRVRTTSSTGMLIESAQSFRAESKLSMHLSLNDRLVDIVCRVTGQTVDPENGGFLMWLEFINVSEDGHCILDCLAKEGDSVSVSGTDSLM